MCRPVQASNSDSVWSTSGRGSSSLSAGARLANIACATGAKLDTTAMRASLSLAHPSFARSTAVATATAISSLSAPAMTPETSFIRFNLRNAKERCFSSSLIRVASWLRNSFSATELLSAANFNASR